ncbi:nucleotidyl transferase AbiEii/AbiGii toxin family protein [Paenibacillus xylanexedens]|uniref:nucleotidyl transferase AbiEii/AbiGii toxin family protein n=1 Tax=Paenibacillus xylanexedens TaxID=528191 RepID=UPI0021B51795|nr:nucleotidyl transferase AbiEii/AbiGii toxin family protein [Paenibacillus xylanexedens]
MTRNGNEIPIHRFNEDERLLIVLEALLKRATLVHSSFILKGSLLTRQYLENPSLRYAEDIDFLYKGTIEHADQAKQIFTDWMIQVTELDLNDGVHFRSFRENAFWREIDYAMDDDFPTVNTDIAYAIQSESSEGNRYEDELFLDISFNLKLDAEPVEFNYQPLRGEPFVVPYTVPLSAQVAWKLHQTIVRPRFKDLYDLQYLVSHPSYDEQAVEDSLQTLVNECSMTASITSEDMKKILVEDLHPLYQGLENDYLLKQLAGERVPEIYFTEVATRLRKALNRAGIHREAFKHLPSPIWNKG